MLGVGGGLMLIGAVSLGSSYATEWNAGIGSDVGFVLGNIGLYIGSSILLTGAVTHRVGVKIKRRAKRDAFQLRLSTPVVGFNRNGAHVGVSMRF